MVWLSFIPIPGRLLIRIFWFYMFSFHWNGFKSRNLILSHPLGDNSCTITGYNMDITNDNYFIMVCWSSSYCHWNQKQDPHISSLRSKRCCVAGSHVDHHDLLWILGKLPQVRLRSAPTNHGCKGHKWWSKQRHGFLHSLCVFGSARVSKVRRKEGFT